MKKHLILVGPPGSGKDTHGKILSQKIGIPLISSGEVLRDEIANRTEIGIRFESLINKGLLVSDDVMETFFEKILFKYDLSKGFILNGFPRTVSQAEFINRYLFEHNVCIDCVLNIAVSDDEIIKRLSGRRTCKKCGAVYNIYYYRSKVDSVCDLCGGELYQRDDDREDIVKDRTKIYIKNTFPLIEYYGKKSLLCEINGNGIIDEVSKRIVEAVND